MSDNKSAVGDEASASQSQSDPAPGADRDEDTTIYVVVANHEEQYSIWPVDRELPRGWRPMGMEGPKPDCLSYIDKVWTDMRPLSLRRFMDKVETSTQAASKA